MFTIMCARARIVTSINLIMLLGRSMRICNPACALWPDRSDLMTFIEIEIYLHLWCTSYYEQRKAFGYWCTFTVSDFEPGF